MPEEAVFNVPSWGTPVKNPGTSTGSAAAAIRAVREETDAATVLQAAERGRRVRKQHREEAEAATRLQSIARGKLARAQQAREAEAVVVLQRAVRERAERLERDRAERESDRVDRALQQSVKQLINWSVAGKYTSTLLQNIDVQGLF